MSEDVLKAPLVLEYPFTRTTGPVVGAFLTGLREGVVLGVKRADGSVLCPPLEYDPADASPLGELVERFSPGRVTEQMGLVATPAEPHGEKRLRYP